MHLLEDTLLVTGLLFWLGLLFVPQFRAFLAMLLHPLLGPVLAVSGVLALLVVSLITTFASVMINRHFVDDRLRTSVAERLKKLKAEQKALKPAEPEKRQAAVMRDQWALNVQGMKSMCAMSLISVPVYSWATTYVLKSPAWIIGWIAISLVMGIVMKVATDRVLKRV